MKESKITLINGNPYFCVDGDFLPPCAYITYFEEHNDYPAFAKEGFRLYSVSLGLADQPINTQSGFTPHAGGIFDQKGAADFSHIDASIRKILEICPDAYIFPRIYVCMPEWWIKENPTETTPVPHDKRREALYSQKFREDAARMLKEVIEYFKSFFAADHIIGYQISGGNTQEWFHLDLNGSYCENALPYFNEYLQKKGLSPVEKLPDVEQIKHCKIIEDTMLSAYIRFTNDSVAETVEFLCKAAKEALEGKQIVGVFYGYTMEAAHHPLWGTHSLARLLDSPYIDFFSSPNSYVERRPLGIDWPDMMAVDSIKLHGKMCFMECDIRTHLSRLPSAVRPDCDPYHIYTSDVWRGPATDTLSAWAVRKCLARQLTHKHGLWWFDMFGHWYATEGLMKEMRRSLELYENCGIKTLYDKSPEVAVILDETANAYVGERHPAYKSANHMRAPLGAAGAPYSLYLLSDFDRIDWEQSPYNAVFFLSPHESDALQRAKERLTALGISTLSVSAEEPTFSAKQLAEFFKQSGVHLFCDPGDVVYFGNGYAALHAASAGEKKLHLPKVLKCTDLITGDQYETDCLHLSCKEYETKLLMIKSE